MPTTPRLKIPYPGENANPWFDSFEDMTNAFDAALYASREDRNIVYSGGGTVTFNSGSGVLAWSANIDIFSPLTGFIWRIAAGNVTLADGQCCFLTLSRAPQSTAVYALTIGTIVPGDLNGDSQLLVAWRHGAIVHFRGGYSIHNGSSISIFDAEPGGGGAGTPGGSPGDVQVNTAGAFAGVSPGTSGNVLTSNGTTWGSAAPVGGSSNEVFANLTGDVSTSSTSYADLISGAITLTGTAVLVHFVFNGDQPSGGAATGYFKLLVDGTPIPHGGGWVTAGASFALSCSALYKVTGLSAGAHTVKYQWKTDPGGTVRANCTTTPDTNSVSLHLREV